MALYQITNLKNGNVVLPPPIGRRLGKYETIRISRPAGMTEANFNRQYSALVQMVRTGLIRVETIEDENVDDNIEVATVSMLGTSGEYRAVADVTARDAIPADERTDGMLVQTVDTGQFWTLEADLTTWTLVLTPPASPPQYLAVADAAARNAIPAGIRVEGMLVRTNDTDQYWALEADLVTWTVISLGTIPASQIGQVFTSTNGTSMAPNIPVTSPTTGWLVNNDGLLLVAG